MKEVSLFWAPPLLVSSHGLEPLLTTSDSPEYLLIKREERCEGPCFSVFLFGFYYIWACYTKDMKSVVKQLVLHHMFQFQKQKN